MSMDAVQAAVQAAASAIRSVLLVPMIGMPTPAAQSPAVAAVGEADHVRRHGWPVPAAARGGGGKAPCGPAGS
jgi:hypothetical protein